MLKQISWAFMQVKRSSVKAPKYTLKSPKYGKFYYIKIIFQQKKLKQHKNINYKTSFGAQFDMKNDNMDNQTRTDNVPYDEFIKHLY